MAPTTTTTTEPAKEPTFSSTETSKITDTLQLMGGRLEQLTVVLSQIVSNRGVADRVSGSGSMESGTSKAIGAYSNYPTVAPFALGMLIGGSKTDPFANYGYSGLSPGMMSERANYQKLADAKDPAQMFLGGILPKGVEFTQRAAEQAAIARSLLQVLATGAEARGERSQFRESLGKDRMGQAALVQDTFQQIRESALTTGNVDETYRLVNSLSSLKGALGGVVSATEAGTQKNRSLITSVQEVAEGAGVSSESIMGALRTLKEQSNVDTLAGQENATKAMKFAASLRTAADIAGLSYDQMVRNVGSVSAGLQLMGDNAQSLLGPMSNLSKRLRESGLSAENAANLSTKFTQNLGQLTMSQKMWISELTGGPGGAEGAFEIESMFTEGRGGEVFSKMQDALQQQLGEIVTLADARSGGAEAAGKRLEQLRLLQATPLGKGLSDTEASRMLEGMARRNVGERDTIDATDSLTKVTAEGRLGLSRAFGYDSMEKLAEMQATADAAPSAYAMAERFRGNAPGEEFKTKVGKFNDLEQQATDITQRGTYGPDLSRATAEKSAETYKKELISIFKPVVDLMTDGLKKGIASIKSDAAASTSDGLKAPVRAVAAVGAPTSTSASTSAQGAVSGGSGSQIDAIPFRCLDCQQKYEAKMEGKLSDIKQSIVQAASAAGASLALPTSSS